MQRERGIGLGALAICLGLLGWWLVRDRESARSVAPVAEEALPSVEVAPAPLASSETRAAIEPSTAGDSSLGPDVVADAGERVAVLVVDRYDAPIAGAIVDVTTDAPLGAHRAGPDGRCTLPLSVDGGPLQLHVSAEGCFDQVVWTRRDAELRVVLCRARTVHGRVATGGAPVAGAIVRVRYDTSEFTGELAATADGAGCFELAGVPEAETGTWRASADGFVTASRTLVVRAEAADVVFELERGVELTFEVVDALTRAPLEGATLWGEVESLVSDRSGRAVTSAFLSDTRDQVRVLAMLRGYCALSGVVTREQALRREVIELPLLAAVRVSGTVSDEQGAAIAGARIFVSCRGREDPRDGGSEGVELPVGWSLRGERERDATVGADGRFTVEGLQPRLGYHVLASAVGRESVTRTLDDLGAAGTTIRADFVLPSLAAVGTLGGTFTLNGTPANGYVGWKGKTREGGAYTHETGRFHLAAVEPGEVVISAWLPTATSGPRRKCEPLLTGLTVAVEPSKESRVDVALTAERKPIRGRVLAADGSAAPGVGVDARSNSVCWVAAATTDANGVFELEFDAEADACVVSAGEGDQRVELEGVAPGSEGLELRLPGVARVSVRVLDSVTRAPVGAFHLSFRGDGVRRFDFDTQVNEAQNPFVGDASGWHIVELPPGQYQAVVSDARSRDRVGYLPTCLPSVELGLGDTNAPIEVLLERGERVVLELAPGYAPWTEPRCVVLLLEERYWSGVDVGSRGWNLAPSAGMLDLPSHMVHFDGSNRARLDCLERGTLRFKVFPPTISIEPAEIVLPRPNDEPVLLRWSRL